MPDRELHSHLLVLLLVLHFLPLEMVLLPNDNFHNLLAARNGRVSCYQHTFFPTHYRPTTQIIRFISMCEKRITPSGIYTLSSPQILNVPYDVFKT